MPKRAPPPASPVVCARRFEPARLQAQLLSAAYEHLVPARQRPEAATTASGPQRSAPAKVLPVASRPSPGVRA
jgi:hypothetical protein